MTADDFRLIALGFPEATESAHMGHPDFRVSGKIFATLWTDGAWGVVLLKPEEQARLLASDPTVFVPAKGGWGTKGGTQVRLEAAPEKMVRRALGMAWQRIAPRKLVAESGLTFH
ncbi:MAG: MmcQ/YjbR family DNA-binding protein [Chthoniobacterales bacterium]